MPERNVNLLLADGAQPTNGIAVGNVKQWYGGPIRVTAAGVWAGATVELMFCTKMPEGGDRADYVNNPGNYTWVNLHTFNADGEFVTDNLNPCALAVRVTNSAGSTRVKVLMLTA